MLDKHDILETIRMIDDESLDIRTITMGISLLDCVSPDADAACLKIYDKICKKAEKLVETGDRIGKEYGVPIINKRVSVTPVALILASAVKTFDNNGGIDIETPVKYAETLQKCADACGVNFIGGYSALVHKGFAPGDYELINSIPHALSVTQNICASVNIGSSKAGINMDAVELMGHIIKKTAENTKNNQSIGAAKLVVFCNAPEDNPFMAGAFHGVGEPDCALNVGVSGPGVVRAAIAQLNKNRVATALAPVSIDELADIIKKTAFKITRMGQLVASKASEYLNVPFGIVDLSLAPTPAEGDSVAYILEEMGLEQCGTHGTTAALAILNDAVKKGGVMASSHVGGLSGAFIPVSEDAGMIAAVESGSLTLDKLEAMTAVCSVGLDMIAVPGDVPDATISAIIADEAAIGMVNNKTTAVRLIPAIGKKVGERLEFGGLLGYAPIMSVNPNSSQLFISRGGRLPSPMHSVKN